MTYTTLIILN
jgi:hypothetical protein